jgi:hypothetical protein
LAWAILKATNLWVAQDQGSKSTHIGSVMTTLVKVLMPFLVNTMLTHWWKKLNVFEGSTWSCFHPMWELASCTMATKVSWIASWVHVCLLPWAQQKRWIPIKLMGCVHIHRGISIIEGWVVQIVFEVLWKRLGKLIKRLGIFFKL